MWALHSFEGMNRTITCASLLPSLFLLACERAPTRHNEGAAETARQQADITRDLPPTIGLANTAANSVDAADMTPPILTPQAERGVEGARNVLLSFARAIEQQQFNQAWAMLSPADQRKWSKAEFAANFAGMKDITVAIPTGTTEGAAGSIYYTAPVTIIETDEDGRPIRMEGEAVLRRVNDVDGATPAQLRWHFGRLTLDWTH